MHAGPSKSPGQFTSPSVPGACQRATNVENAAEARCQALPLHPPLLPRAFASAGPAPSSSEKTQVGRRFCHLDVDRAWLQLAGGSWLDYARAQGRYREVQVVIRRQLRNKLVTILRHENNVKLHLDLIFHLHRPSRDADRSYPKGALLESGGTQVVTVPEVHVDRDRGRLPMQS